LFKNILLKLFFYCCWDACCFYLKLIVLQTQKYYSLGFVNLLCLNTEQINQYQRTSRITEEAPPPPLQIPAIPIFCPLYLSTVIRLWITLAPDILNWIIKIANNEKESVGNLMKFVLTRLDDQVRRLLRLR